MAPVIKCSSNPCKAIDQHHNLTPAFQFRLHMTKHQLGKFNMFINALVARTGYHFSTLCCPAKLRHFFGPLVYQQHDNAALGRAFMYTSYHLFQKNRLTSLGR
jgi:hypothetical protein